MTPRLLLRTALLSATVALCSCASVKVQGDQGQRASRQASAPRKVYVAPFSYAHANIKQHPMRKHRGQLGQEAQEVLADYLVKELGKHLAPAQLVRSPSAVPRDAWLVSGEFTRLNEGSRFLRMGIGLGAGGTKMETRVAVTAGGQKQPFLRFATSGGSGSMPGWVFSPPFSGAAMAAMQSRLGVSDDAARTARVITNRLLTHLGRPPTAGVQGIKSR